MAYAETELREWMGACIITDLEALFLLENAATRGFICLLFPPYPPPPLPADAGLW